MFQWFKEWLKRRRRSQLEHATESDMPVSTDICVIEDLHGEEVDYECGHRMREKFVFSFFGLKNAYKDEAYSQRNWCANCLLEGLSKDMIRCCKCGFGIMSGEGVMVYPENASIPIRNSWGTSIRAKEVWLIGCVRMGCLEHDGYLGTMVLVQYLPMAQMRGTTKDGRLVSIVFNGHSPEGTVRNKKKSMWRSRT